MLTVAKKIEIDSKKFRHVMSHFATGVTICTTKSAERNHGITINSFTSVSLEPALVLFCLSKHSSEHSAFSQSEGFCVNLLAANQQQLSNHFASHSRRDWSGIKHSYGPTGAPVLDGSLAHIHCRIWQRYDGGDHDIIVGEVVELDIARQTEPLLYYKSNYM